MTHQGFRVQEMKWLEDHQGELKQMPLGLWLAIDGDELIAVASTLAVLMELSASKRHPNPFVTAVPLPIGGLYATEDLLHV